MLSAWAVGVAHGSATAWRVSSIWRRIPAVSGGHAIADKAMPKNQWHPPPCAMPCALSLGRYLFDALPTKQRTRHATHSIYLTISATHPLTLIIHNIHVDNMCIYMYIFPISFFCVISPAGRQYTCINIYIK